MESDSQSDDCPETSATLSKMDMQQCPKRFCNFVQKVLAKNTRYYNPVLGRIMQEDPYRGDGLNLYAHCQNNPVMHYDPNGYTGTPANPNCPGAKFQTEVPEDVYVFGNEEKAGDARPGKDFHVEDRNSMVPDQTSNLPLPNGKSVVNNPTETTLTGPYYKIPGGTQLPDGLGIVYDGRDKVPGGHNEGPLPYSQRKI